MSLEDRAERAIAEHLRSIQGAAVFRDDDPKHLKVPQDNLIEGLSLDKFESDFTQGAGKELEPQNGEPPKLCAARSSSALAVNAFGPFRHQPVHLRVDGMTGFQDAQFEYPCPNGLQGTDPHFDFWAISESAVLSIESKFLEPLKSPKTADFTLQYDRPFRGDDSGPAIAEAQWTRVFAALKENPRLYVHLDAAQLVKHYLGLKHSYPDKKRVLLYIYWEPTNADEFEEFKKHRQEVTDFENEVSGCDTRFAAFSYQTLWADWESTSAWPGMPVHLARLRARYLLAI